MKVELRILCEVIAISHLTFLLKYIIKPSYGTLKFHSEV